MTFFSALWLIVLIPAISRAAADSATLDAIKKAGGVVSSAAGGYEIGFHHSGRELSNAGLETVANLKDVVSLNLRDTKITGAGLVHLKNLTNLRRLHLERTAVGDEGFEHLAGLQSLEYLNLYSTKITDASLAHLGGLKNLKQLYVWQTGVTDAGCQKLKAALPKLRIVRGVDLDKAMAAAKKAKEAPVVLVDLKWIPAGTEEPPRSKTGTFTTVKIKNMKDHRVKLYWVEYGGGLKFYSEIAAGATLVRNTYSDATWLITDENDSRLGHFIVTLKPSQVVIPK